MEPLENCLTATLNKYPVHGLSAEPTLFLLYPSMEVQKATQQVRFNESVRVEYALLHLEWIPYAWTPMDPCAQELFMACRYWNRCLLGIPLPQWQPPALLEASLIMERSLMDSSRAVWRTFLQKAGLLSATGQWL